ncbi:MAG: hypothetical protein IPO93_13095 [Actinobacteria bacterium]|nr:hypothetical protein [Actinomycetota bacterium]
MTRSSGVRSTAAAFGRTVGAWLHPVSAYRPHSELERHLQYRVGVVSIFFIASGAITMLAAIVLLIPDISSGAHFPQINPTTFVAAISLVLVTVFAPQAIFRTRNAALTREVLSNPSAPIRPWRSTTITFDAVLVGAMLAGLYYDAELSVLFFGAALILRMFFKSRTDLASDPNARFHNLLLAWTSAASGGVAYIIISPLAASVSVQGSIAPLVLAGLVAMYVGLVFNALERWVNGDRTRWAFARDAVDTRRIVVVFISAFIAWLVVIVSDVVSTLVTGDGVVAGSLAGLGVLAAAWLVLWFVAIRLWSRDAMRTMTMWATHAAEIMTRIADGSLGSELASRASAPIAARMAVSIFGATRVMVVLDDAKGHVTTHLVAVDQYDHAPEPDPHAVTLRPNLRLPLYPTPDHPNRSSVTIAGWLWTGWFMTRSRQLVELYTDLATSTLLTPVLSSDDDRLGTAFDAMFDGVSRWPTLDAFGQAVERMQARADENPHSDSLIIGVYAIDDFGALEGGRFEQAAVAQVMRLALGHADFAGHDLFVAYEAPGRLWVALSGGPIIRNGIATLRGLQQHINDHGSVPSARLDVDVHVSVSFGYAAHQVDEFTCDGLMATALNRLAADQSSRDPFAIENLMSYDIRPEDIIGDTSGPVTAIDVLHLLNADHVSSTGNPFTTQFTPVVRVTGGNHDALVALVGWQRSFGTLDLSEASTFLSLVGRQPRLAAEATRIILERMKAVYAEADHLGHADLPIVVSLPPTLLHPDANELALPNLLTPFLSRRECARTIVMFDTVPTGAGQALRLLSDRGLQIAVTAAAAAAAEPADLFGWQRWGVVFPQHVIQGPAGVDGLTIQQTVSAIASHDTRLIGVADQWADPRELTEHNVGWRIDPAERYESVRESIGSAAPHMP